jgi:hypothetical protein
MIIVKIMGGLGNQMFQQAFAYAVSRNTPMPVLLDATYYQQHHLRRYALEAFTGSFPTAHPDQLSQVMYREESLLARIYRRLRRKARAPASERIYRETSLAFDGRALKPQAPAYYEGYWQSERYFAIHRSELLRLFRLRQPLSQPAAGLLQQMQQVHSVSLHVRRGDYANNPEVTRVHGILPLSYYESAAQLITRKSPSPHFFIFSDDLPWTRQHLDFLPSRTFVELPPGTPDVEEIYLMASCRDNIVANSSFSWWGAWLNPNPTKVTIAPGQWFSDERKTASDLIPETWLRL